MQEPRPPGVHVASTSMTWARACNERTHARGCHSRCSRTVKARTLPLTGCVPRPDHLPDDSGQHRRAGRSGVRAADPRGLVRLHAGRSGVSFVPVRGWERDEFCAGNQHAASAVPRPCEQARRADPAMRCADVLVSFFPSAARWWMGVHDGRSTSPDRRIATDRPVLPGGGIAGALSATARHRACLLSTAVGLLGVVVRLRPTWRGIEQDRQCRHSPGSVAVRA